MFVIATLAAMIASQAMISATFSCIKQSMALGCFPRLKIIHTSKRFIGQIYIPIINWFLMIMCIVVVSIFQSTTDIANAYGQCPSSQFISCSILFSHFLIFGSGVTTGMLIEVLYEMINYIEILFHQIFIFWICLFLWCP